MKKRSILPVFLLAAALASCAAESSASGSESSSGGTSTAENLLAYFSLPYHVEARGTSASLYPSPYQGLSYETNYSISYDYGSIEKDGETLEAVRDSSGTVHYENEEGAAAYDTLNQRNEVVSIEETRLYATVLYSEAYRDPMLYISPENISEDLSLDHALAGFLTECYLGVSWAVESAKFNVSANGVPESLSVTYLPRYDGLEVSDSETGVTEILTIESSFEASFSFSFDVAPFESVSPLTNENAALETALNEDLSNFTLSFSSNALSTTYTYYATEEAIYLHAGNTDTMEDGDVYYQWNAARESYVSYSYDASSAIWTRETSLEKNQILPDLSLVDSALFVEEGEGQYSMDEEAVALSAAYFVIPSYFSTFSEGTGESVTVTLSEGHVSSVTAAFLISASQVATNMSYRNVGTTSMPEFLSFEA